MGLPGTELTPNCPGFILYELGRLVAAPEVSVLLSAPPQQVYSHPEAYGGTGFT